MAIERVSTRRWFETIAVVLAALGSMSALAGAMYFFNWQAGIPEARVWPQPALTLINWALVGVGGFVITYLAAARPSAAPVKAAWALSGTLLPLVILGAFSIGLAVLISLLFLLAAAALITIRKGLTWLDTLGLFTAGAILQLGLFFIYTVLARAGG